MVGVLAEEGKMRAADLNQGISFKGNSAGIVDIAWRGRRWEDSEIRCRKQTRKLSSCGVIKPWTMVDTWSGWRIQVMACTMTTVGSAQSAPGLCVAHAIECSKKLAIFAEYCSSLREVKGWRCHLE